jgi:ketosteroid isomerase-like protein
MPPNALTIQGKNAVMDYVQPSFGKFTHHRNILIEEIKVAGDFAFTRVVSKVKYKPKTGEGEFTESNNKGIFLLRRMSDGTWLCTHCMWNSSDSLPTSQENQ